ncbi:MAG: peptidylprolyl isomerase [Candidatus Zixiibacteriota bacterium]
MRKLTIFLFAFLSLIPAAIMMSGCGGDEGLVLAKVDGEKIYAQDIDDIFDRNREVFSSFDEELQWRKTILDSLVIQQLLIKEAYKKNIDESEEVNRIVLGNRDQFLLDILYMRQVSDQVDVTDEEIKDYYSKLEYKVRASHILVDNEDTAKMVIDSLQAGSSFENLAVKYSRDASAQRNRGDLGYFIWGQMDPVFQEQVFKLNPGETSAPFQTKYGWHIVKMVDRTPNELRGTYEKMYDQIRSAAENQKRSARLEEYRAELMKKYPITVDTITCQYLLHKRASLYPPSILETLPKNDFDLNQLDRDEKELILASWDGGQMALGQYLVSAKKFRQNQRPDFDDYNLLAEFIFNVNIMDILSLEARRLGLEDDPEYKRKLKKFRELAMADIMENDSLPIVSTTDEGEMLQYYEDNPAEFTVPGKIHLYEIMFNDYNTANTYVKKIGSLSKFKALASEFTERSGKRAEGGDLGWVDERMYPRLYKAAELADVGKILGPIPVGGKHSIIYIAEKRPSEVQDFEGVRPAIKEKLDKLRRSQAFEEWVQERQKSASIKIYENNIRASINKAKYTESETKAEADSTQG